MQLNAGQKLMIWFSAAMILLTAMSLGLLYWINNAVIQKSVQDRLVDTVVGDMNFVTYVPLREEIAMDREKYTYVDYPGGYIRVDNDFIVDQYFVYVSLYDATGALLLGKNPAESVTQLIGFDEETVQTVPVSNTMYFVYDHRLSGEGLENVMIRGVAQADKGTSGARQMVEGAMIVLPLLVLLAEGVALLILIRDGRKEKKRQDEEA